MSKRSRSTRRQRRTEERAAERELSRPRHSTPRRRRTPWGKILGWGGGALVGGVFLLAIVSGLGAANTEVDPGLVTVAEASSGGTVRAIGGTRHTVYHSQQALPSADAPQVDGRPTLVWFSGTWCEFCERMSPFAHRTAAQFTDRVVFVEKSVDHDRDATSRYGIRGSPFFVLIDANGRELLRFGYQSSTDALASTIEQALASVGA